MGKVPPNKRPTNMVFQSYAIFPHLSVKENVGFGLRRREGTDEEKVRQIEDSLEMVGLKGLGHRAAHALSGGQRQRVARALILRPKVLLLDEPLSALDKQLREQMQAELRRLQRAVGITFILVTHDQEEALIMSDRIAVMFDGNIAQVDRPQDLYRRPSSRRVAEFIGVMSFLPAKLDVSGDRLSVDVAGLGRAEIETDQCPGDIREGAARVGIRPETMTILGEGEETAERVAEGEVEDRAYYGDMTSYTVKLKGADARIAVTMKNRGGRAVLDPGDEVRLGWEPGSLVVFGG